MLQGVCDAWKAVRLRGFTGETCLSNDDFPQESSAKRPKGFFAVDWRCVEDATRYGDGINTAAAYLVLARFTPKNNRTTLAGMTAIHTRTGLSRGRADLALKTLVRAGLLTMPKRGTARSLVPWGNLLAERGNLSQRQQAVLQRILGKKDPIISAADPDYQVALSLSQKGILEKVTPGAGKSRFRAPSPDWVWLPNTIVDGFGEGDTPLARLRQIQDSRAILLLLDCYRLTNLAEDGGLPWQYVRREYKRVNVFTRGQFTVWGFAPGNMTGQWDPLFTRFKGKDHDPASIDLWRVYGALVAAGFLEDVGHIVESLKDGAQPIHPYALSGKGEPEERAVTDAAHAAGRRMITDHKHEGATEQLGEPPWLCPVRSHVTDVQLVGVVRVVHRPHTRKTAAWAANFLHRCEAHTALFESLEQSAMSAAA
jgi:hypothetical protein